MYYNELPSLRDSEYFELNEIDNSLKNIKLNEEFGIIIGLYLACGYNDLEYIYIKCETSYISNIVINWCESPNVVLCSLKNAKLKCLIDKELIEIRAYFIYCLFEKWLYIENGYKTIESKILFSNENLIIGVLNGYFAGNGVVCTKSKSLIMQSISKKLIDCISYLCARLSIVGNVTRDFLYYTYIYTIHDDVGLWFKIIGCCDPIKYNLIYDIINS